MADLRRIAEKIAAHRVTFAKPRVPPQDGIDWAGEIVSRSPTVTLLCLLASAGVAGALVAFVILVVS